MDIKGYILPALIISFGVFMYKFNTGHANEIFDNPKSNDYYVMKNYPDKEAGELVFKIHEVRNDSIVFFVPHQKFIGGFKINKSESKVRQSNMFGDETTTISRTELKELKENDGLSGAVTRKPMITHIFQ